MSNNSRSSGVWDVKDYLGEIAALKRAPEYDEPKGVTATKHDSRELQAERLDGKPW
jgi:hypothetical protein